MEMKAEPVLKPIDQDHRYLSAEQYKWLKNILMWTVIDVVFGDVAVIRIAKGPNYFNKTSILDIAYLSIVFTTVIFIFLHRSVITLAFFTSVRYVDKVEVFMENSFLSHKLKKK